MKNYEEETELEALDNLLSKMIYKTYDQKRRFRVFRESFIGINNLIKWFKLIWNDRDWDYPFLYQLIYFKLDNMQKFYESDKTFTTDALKTADEIRVAKALLFTLLNNEWYGNDKLTWKQQEEQRGQIKALFFNQLSQNIDKWWD